jgi:hypothetical protein
MNLRDTLNRYNIKSLWHFTDESNLASIQKYGLLSLELLTQRDIQVSCYGANALSHNLDRNLGLDKFVHLALIKDHPMQYIKKNNGDMPNPIWLEIDVSVLSENYSRCCKEVANKNGAKCYDIKHLATVIDLKTLLSYPYGNNPIKKAELIVANQIDYSKIKGVYRG